jgi:hypothetical protein
MRDRLWRWLAQGALVASGCQGGPEGLVRWSARPCVPTDGAVPDGGDASAERCDPRANRVANTALPTPRPDPRVFRCNARVTGEGVARTFEVSFVANDPRGASLTLSGAALTSASTIGVPVASCVVTVTEGGRSATGDCGGQCSVTITSYAEASRTISGRLSCTAMRESGASAQWQIANAEGVPGMAADFSLANCEPPSAAR